MTIAAPLQSNFGGGEVSPLLHGRVDSPRYKESLALCKNWIPTLQGALHRRPGTKYVGNAKGATTRLIPFQYSTLQAYILEFGDGYIRFWANYGQITQSGSPVELSTGYSASDLFNIKFVQSADTLYITHPKHPPQKLQRMSDTYWSISTIAFQDGPYGLINTTPFTLTPSGTAGTITTTIGNVLSVSAYTNDGNGKVKITVGSSHPFKSGDTVLIYGVSAVTPANGYFEIKVIDSLNFVLLGSTFGVYTSGGSVVPAFFYLQYLRMEISGSWGWGQITGVSNNTLTVNLITTLGGTAATISWRAGLWTGSTPSFPNGNHPGTVAFHEDRLCFSGTPSMPQRVDMSCSSDYENFSPTKSDGTVQNNNALSFSLNATDVNLIQWLNSDERGLLAGSSAAEWVIRPSTTLDAITPTNISAKRSSKWGNANIAPVQVAKSTLHVQRGGRKIRELMYYFDIDGYRTTDLTELSDHITGNGVVDIAFQSVPFPIVWLVREDGALIGLTYDRELGALKVGWHWHNIGGTLATVESIAAIPSPDGTQDDLWMVVQRYVNGGYVRHIEYMTRIFQDIDLQKNAFFVDCGSTYDNPIPFEATLVAGQPIVLDCDTTDLVTGNSVRIDDADGLLSGTTVCNGKTFTITVLSPGEIQLNGTSAAGTTYYLGTGNLRKLITHISGLSYLQGEKLSVLADGFPMGPFTVDGTGAITLTKPSAVVNVGYGYDSDGQLLRLEAGSRNGTALGKTRRIHRIGAMFHRSYGFKLGQSFDQLYTFSNTLNTNLCSGIVSENVDFDYDFDNSICFRVSDPLPCILLAIMPQLETQDRA